jgi:HMG (high mobility group) box
MTTNIKKLNTLVAGVFESEIENFSELWLNNASVQKDIKALFASSAGARSKKDPNAPKRGKSAYLFFCAALRDTVKTSLGADSKATEVTKELGARWNKLKASTKASDKKALSGFETEALADKARYDSEKVDYVPPVGDDLSEPKRRGGKKVNKDGPKRAKSAYLFFCDANRNSVKSKDPSLKATEVTSELGRLWNELKADKTRVSDLDGFISLATADTARYQQEKADGVVNSSTDKVSTKAVKPAAKSAKPAAKSAKSTKAEKPAAKSTKVEKPVKAEKKTKGKVVQEEEDEEELMEEEDQDDVKSSKKTSDTGFQAFSSEKRAEIKMASPKMKPAEITKKLNADWKALSKEEQKNWKQSVSN